MGSETAITRLEFHIEVVRDKRFMPPDLADVSVIRFLKSQAVPI